MHNKHIVVLSGAGVSAESGIPTFRGSNGLWEGHDVTQVASPAGWAKDRALVLEFYNQRRRNMQGAEPNAGHYCIAEMERHFKVTVITQNIDNLHERAGSTHVLHLHGEIMKSRSSLDPTLVYDIAPGTDLVIGDKCERGSQLRPHIVWFGEDVPLIYTAAEIVMTADIVIVVGTSLVVYPAAGLLDWANDDVPIYLVDPNSPHYHGKRRPQYIPEPGTTGLPKLLRQLLES
jgi:NAD-dependent deacetylase